MKHARLLSLALVTVTTALATGVGSAGCAVEQAEESEDDVTSKPAQYVMFAFDGSKANGFWQESRDFAKSVKKADGKPALRFTYFINPSYYIPTAQKDVYCGPKVSCGQSAIGFGGTEAEITERIAQTAAAHREGHAIESHAVGHFDGSSWSEADWNKEFDAFNKHFFLTPGGAARPQLDAIKAAGIVGFRAPQLGHSTGLFLTLKNKGFTYDTSRINQPNYWPEKLNGVWNFPLASLTLKNTGKRTLSMDYNHYIAHSKGNPDGANAEKYRQDVYATYMAYFDKNYNGNRAPLHIGHHFSKWNGGAYWSAMKDFALAICTRADVICGTYRELVSFMEALPAGKRARLQAGNFQDSANQCPAEEQACSGESAAAHDDE